MKKPHLSRVPTKRPPVPKPAAKPVPAKLVAPHDVDGVVGGAPDVDAFEIEAEVVDQLHKRKEALLSVMREAGSKIPDGLSPSQKQALLQVRSQASGNAMRLLGEFSAYLDCARRARWISFEAYRDGVDTLVSLRSRGPAPAPAKT